jgi:uncharacterized protein YkwD
VPTRHRKPTRTRFLALSAVAAGVLGAGFAGIASAQTTHHRPHAAGRTATLLGSATGATQAPSARRPHRPRPSTAPTSTGPTSTGPTSTGPTSTTPPSTIPPGTTAPATEVPTASPTTAAPTTTAPATQPPTVAPTAVPTTAPTTAPAGDPVIDAVLTHINAARSANGLAAYAISADLSKASAAHNALMVGGCGLSHQCPGEAGLGDRFTAAGVSWTSAGENIGQGNADDNAASIIKAANGLTDLMLAEVAPNDGHRRNLLNSGFKHIGLAVTRGSDGRVWVTQDFVN